MTVRTDISRRELSPCMSNAVVPKGLWDNSPGDSSQGARSRSLISPSPERTVESYPVGFLNSNPDGRV